MQVVLSEKTKNMLQRIARRNYAKVFGVVGAGQMGTGIAIVAAQQAKLQVKIMDSNASSLEKSKKFIGMIYCV